MSDAPPAKNPAPSIEAFPCRVTHTIRQADIDHLGHVNNTAFAVFFESGRVQMIDDAKHGLREPGATLVLARTEIDYLREMHFPGSVEIGTSITRIGRTSFTFGHALFNGGLCAGTGRATMVLIDSTTRRPRPLPDALLRNLRYWYVEGADAAPQRQA